MQGGSGEAGFLGESRLLYVLIYAAFAGCFLITCFTNDVIIDLFRELTGRGADWPQAASHVMYDATGDYYDQFWLGSLKSAAFLAALVVFGYLLRDTVAQSAHRAARRALWLDIGGGLLIASIFLLAIMPNGMGRIYSYISVDPFLQHQGYYHRRILMPALAHQLQLGGVLYGVFFWLVALTTFALTSIFLETKGLVLSRLELASLYTSGVFASALAIPGYPEIMVLCLTLVALLDFDRTGIAGPVQLICFGLALLTHESTAVLAFGSLALFYFDRKSIVPMALLLALYVLIWLASNRFDPIRAATLQMAGGSSSLVQFWHHLPRVLVSLFASLKLLLVAGLSAIAVHLTARRFRDALLIGCALVGSTALTMIATDFTRMISFSTFALLLALPVVLNGFSARKRAVLATINLVIPTVYVAAGKGVFAYGGLYGFILTHYFGVRG